MTLTYYYKTGAYQLTLDIDDSEGLPTIESKTVESPVVALP